MSVTKTQTKMNATTRVAPTTNAPRVAQPVKVVKTVATTIKQNNAPPKSLPEKKKKLIVKPDLSLPRQPPRNLKRSPDSHDPLPRSTASVVHPRKDDISGIIQSRLKKKSPWYDSIMKPITGGGVKIPDAVGTNTGTYQHVQNISIPVNAQGVAGLRCVCPYVNSYQNANGSNYQRTISTSSASNLAWGNNTDSGAMLAFTAIPALMKSNSTSHRVVSGSVTAQAETSTLNDAGEMVAFVTPFRCNVAAVSTATYQAQWDSAIVPINTHKPLCSRWYPLSSDWNQFNGDDYSAGSESTISYQDFIDPNHGLDTEQDLGVIPWEFGVICSGMTPSVGTVRFQIVINYEFIPLTSTAMVTQNASPIDPMEEQSVLSWVASEPMTGIITQKQASQAPSDTTVPQEETGFGLFADVVKQIVPLALSML